MTHLLEAQLDPAFPAKRRATPSIGDPIGRYLTPTEIANTVLFLCSDLARRLPARNTASTAPAPPPAVR